MNSPWKHGLAALVVLLLLQPANVGAIRTLSSSPQQYIYNPPEPEQWGSLIARWLRCTVPNLDHITDIQKKCILPDEYCSFSGRPAILDEGLVGDCACNTGRRGPQCQDIDLSMFG